MWYKQAIDLSNLRGFSPVETSVDSIDKKPLTESIPHRVITKFHENRDEIDNVLQFGGLDPEAPFVVDYAEKLLVIIGQLVPALEGVLNYIEERHILRWLNFGLLRYTSLNWVIEDTKNLIILCKNISSISDPRERVEKFLHGFKISDGLYGLIANLVMIFNTIVKVLNEFTDLHIDNKWTFAAYFYGAPFAKYLFEESGADEDKSGLRIIKERVINPTAEYLFKKNSKNRIVYNYALKYIGENPDKTHDEVRDHVLDRFDEDTSKGRFVDMPGEKLNSKDILEIIDILYDDPYDVIGLLRGKRINKTYYDKFIYLMNNSSSLQTKCIQATNALNDLLQWMSHIKFASNQRRIKSG